MIGSPTASCQDKLSYRQEGLIFKAFYSTGSKLGHLVTIPHLRHLQFPYEGGRRTVNPLSYAVP